MVNSNIIAQQSQRQSFGSFTSSLLIQYSRWTISCETWAVALTPTQPLTLYFAWNLSNCTWISFTFYLRYAEFSICTTYAPFTKSVLCFRMESAARETHGPTPPYNSPLALYKPRGNTKEAWHGPCLAGWNLSSQSLECAEVLLNSSLLFSPPYDHKVVFSTK